MIGSTQRLGSLPGAVSEWKAPAEEAAAHGPSAESSAQAQSRGGPPLSRLEIAALAHRLRNPLAAIHQSVETLGRCLRAGSEESQLCDIALEETRRLERTVARALRGARELERTHVDLAALLRRVVELIRLDPRARSGIELALRVEDAELIAQVDVDRVSEALWSLLENALDAVAGGGQIAIAGAAQHSLGVAGVRIDVLDSGAGFDEAAERGAPAPFASTRPLGSGIGLRIARDVAHAHGGFLRLRNANEGGARVSLWLPLGPAER